MALLLFGIVGGSMICTQAAGIDALVEADTLEQIATGFSFTEGPVWHPDGYLLFSDIPGNTIHKWLPDGSVETFRSPSGHANGLIFDRQGRLIACEHSNRRVSRTEPDGTIVTLVSEYDGSRLNSPNDAVVKSDGSIYFTDPPFGLTADYGIPGIQELPFEGVFRLSPDGETLELLETELFPNGLAFSPDEKVLYVMAQEPGRIYAYDVQPDGLLANRRVFTDLSAFPDGMKVDIMGNLYVTNNSLAVQVYDSEGMHLGDIVTPEPASNCGFGGDNNCTLFITADTSVYRVQMKVQGALPHPADPEKARAVAPAPGTTVNQSEVGSLVWIAGETAVQHDVYLGTDFNDVNNANVTDMTGIYRGRQDFAIYTLPEAPELGRNYCWRIDEVKADDTIHKGDVWSFTVADYLIVDDFESYTDDEAAGEAIYQTWIDGFGIADNGAQVGYLFRPYCEQTIVHGGSQSMPLLYVNEAGVTNSEATLTLTALRDWTQAGLAELSLWFQGISSNAAEPLYVAVSSGAGSSAVVTHDDASAATVSSWTQWRIPLQAFADLGINLTDVDKLAIGLGNKGGPALGGSGTMYIDDIRLYTSIPEIVVSSEGVWIEAEVTGTITP
jgi:gluconolactonase